MLDRGRFALRLRRSSIPRAATRRSRPSTSSSSAARRTTSSSSARTGGSSRSASSADFYLRAQFPDGDDRLRRVPHAASRSRATKLARHAPGDRHDLAPGLRLRDRLPADRRGPLPRGRRAAAPSTCATTCASSTPTRTSSTGTTASTSRAASEKKILASEFGDDYDAIPAYEQIYALAGPTQTYRVTGDPRILSDIEMTHRALQHVLPRPRRRAASSRTSTRSRSTRARESLGAQPGAQELELGRRPRARLPDQPVARDRRRAVRRLPRAHRRHDRRRTSPTTRTARSCRRTSTRTGRHDHAWGWQQNRAVVGHNLKIAWNLMRINSVRAERRSTSSSPQKIAEIMPAVGSDQQRGGWYDVMEREQGRRPGVAPLRLARPQGVVAAGAGDPRLPDPRRHPRRRRST